MATPKSVHTAAAIQSKAGWKAAGIVSLILCAACLVVPALLALGLGAATLAAFGRGVPAGVECALAILAPAAVIGSVMLVRRRRRPSEAGPSSPSEVSAEKHCSPSLSCDPLGCKPVPRRDETDGAH